MRKQLKLFVWTGYQPDWTDGLAFAIAATEEAARKLVEDARGLPVSEWGDLQVLPLDAPVAFCVSGGS